MPGHIKVTPSHIKGTPGHTWPHQGHIQVIPSHTWPHQGHTWAHQGHTRPHKGHTRPHQRHTSSYQSHCLTHDKVTVTAVVSHQADVKVTDDHIKVTSHDKVTALASRSLEIAGDHTARIASVSSGRAPSTDLLTSSAVVVDVFSSGASFSSSCLPHRRRRALATRRATRQGALRARHHS